MTNCCLQVWCEEILCSVSRSFAIVIQQLPFRLRVSICIFYLVLRGLDTIEDDMDAFDSPSSSQGTGGTGSAGRKSFAEKVSLLENFHKILDRDEWTLHGVGQGQEAALLEDFTRVCHVFQALSPREAEVIRDICKKMGAGMAEFLDRDLSEVCFEYCLCALAPLMFAVSGRSQ